MADLPPPLTQILSDADLTALRAQYDEQAMTDVLSKPLPAIDPDPRFATYIEAIRDAFYLDPAPPDDDLTVLDRERILIALLAARGLRYELALHCYIALMSGAPPAHVAKILFLTALYSGVPSVANGLAVLETTLLTLKQSVASSGPLDPADMAATLKATFPS